MADELLSGLSAMLVERAPASEFENTAGDGDTVGSIEKAQNDRPGHRQLPAEQRLLQRSTRPRGEIVLPIGGETPEPDSHSNPAIIQRRFPWVHLSRNPTVQGQGRRVEQTAADRGELWI